MINLTGIDTGKALVDEIRKERKSESQNHLLEPLLALTGSLTLTQTDAVSSLHKCEIHTQLYLSSKLSIPEAIL
jgi:polyamine oxidase